ncbi:hypothetical protein M2138_000024 [Dysgonomonadaceae bacterium PH5-43]|nr:hypothetical protein [Dysgonomonadaceae bacterium PH5-43]
MNKLNKYFLLLICTCCISLPSIFSQTVEQVYGLRIKSANDFIYNIPYPISIDSTQVTNKGVHPSRLKYQNVVEIYNNGKKRVVFGDDECYLFLSKTIVLPNERNKQHSCSVSLNYKSEIDSVRFIITALDKYENTLYSDSAFLNKTDQWTDLTFNFHKEKTQAINLILFRDGRYDEDQDLSLYLDRISVRLGDQELNDRLVDSLVEKDKIQLNPKAIVKLSSQDINSFSAIKEWKNKKLIALGSSLENIDDILNAQVQSMKYLISSENCKLILLEVPVNLCTRWNLYLQGIWTEVDEGKLNEELKDNVAQPQIWFDFFKWVRKYNMTAKNPVRVAGTKLDVNQHWWLKDYLLTLSDNEKDSIYIQKALTNFYRKEIVEELKEYILQSSIVKKLNKQDCQYLMYTLDVWSISPLMYIGYESDESRLTSFESHTKRIEQAIDIYLSSNEKAILIAPLRRINKRYPLLNIAEKYGEDIKSDQLGSYLHQRYGKKYFAVSFQLGERPQNHNWIPKSNQEYNFHTFPFAFERAALDTKLDYFYYPSNKIPDGIMGLNMYFRPSGINNIPFRYCYIPYHFDALVFISDWIVLI